LKPYQIHFSSTLSHSFSHLKFENFSGARRLAHRILSPSLGLHPHPKSTLRSVCERLIRVENDLPPTGHRPKIRPENKGIKPITNRHIRAVWETARRICPATAGRRSRSDRASGRERVQPRIRPLICRLGRRQLRTPTGFYHSAPGCPAKRRLPWVTNPKIQPPIAKPRKARNLVADFSQLSTDLSHSSRLGNGEKNLSRYSGTKVAAQVSPTIHKPPQGDTSYPVISRYPSHESYLSHPFGGRDAVTFRKPIIGYCSLFTPIPAFLPPRGVINYLGGASLPRCLHSFHPVKTPCSPRLRGEISL